PPVDSPDPLHNDRWYILGGFAFVLAAGAVYVAKQRPTKTAMSGPAVPSSPRAASAPTYSAPASSSSAGARASTAPPHSAMLLEALKEELFQLEMERQQGHISPQDYDKAKAALDQTLQRALSRNKNK